MTLTEFLLARIAEDEAVARKYRPHEYLTTRDGSDLSGAEQGGNDAIAITSGRVLAECEAKRRIVELADEATGFDMNLDSDRRLGLRDTAAEPYLGDQILAALALPYADHPDYRPEWKPDTLESRGFRHVTFSAIDDPDDLSWP